MTGMALGVGILLGCGVDPTNVLQAEKADGSEPVLSTNALAQTNGADLDSGADLDKEPILKSEPAPFKTSPGVDEVVKLAESGVGDAVIEAYVENSPIAYDLSAGEILYLTDLGISEPS
jgi:hypothetical protein